MPMCQRLPFGTSMVPFSRGLSRLGTDLVEFSSLQWSRGRADFGLSRKRVELGPRMSQQWESGGSAALLLECRAE